MSTKRLIKRPLRPPTRPSRPPIRPPRPVIFPTIAWPAVSVVEPRPPKPPVPAGAEPTGAAPSPADGPPTPPSAEPSAEGSEHVRWVQSSLNQILGLRLPLDGVMGPEVRSAVRSFQQREGLPVDGIVGPDTERALIAARGGKSPQASAPTEPSEPGTTPPAPGMTEPAEPATPPPAAEFDFEWETRSTSYEIGRKPQPRPPLRSDPAGTGNRPKAPLLAEKVPGTIRARPSKSGAHLAVTIPLHLPAGASISLQASRDPNLPVAELTGGPPATGVMLIVRGMLGNHASPPPTPIKAYVPLPRAQLKSLQQKFRALPGSVPEHLAILPVPRPVPAALSSTARIQVKLPLNRSKDVHEPTTVFLPDGRKVFHDTSFPWSTIGRIDTPGGVCSGVMIGPRHVLTCSHGIDWKSSGAGWVKFTPAYFDGGIPPFGSTYGTKIYYYRKVKGADGIDRDEGQYDYAVVVLASRLGALSGFMGARSWSDDWDDKPYWWHAGYPSDLVATERPCFQKGIGLDGSFWDREIHTRIFHKGDVFPGQSGGPFFAWWAGEAYPSVVAVQSSQNTSENAASGGADMVELVDRARREFP